VNEVLELFWFRGEARRSGAGDGLIENDLANAGRDDGVDHFAQGTSDERACFAVCSRRHEVSEPGAS
jgi:hypothetical protein